MANDPQVIQNRMDPVYAPYWEKLLKGAQGEVGTPWQGYEGERIAGFNPMEQNAFGGIGSLGIPQPYQQGVDAGAYGLDQSMGMGQQGYDDMMQFQPGMTRLGQEAGNVRQWTDPGVAQSYMNPYMQNVTDITQRNLERQGAQQLQQLGGQAGTAGAFGGSRHGLAESQVRRDTRQQSADARTQGLAEAYSQGIGAFGDDRKALYDSRGQQADFYGAQAGMAGDANKLYQSGIGSLMTHAGQMADMGQMGQNMDLARLQAQMAAGNMQRQHSQANLDVGYQDWQAQQNHPQNQMNWMANILSGLPQAPTGVQDRQTPYSGSLFNDMMSIVPSAYASNSSIGQ